MGADRSIGLEQSSDAVYCARHPEVETYLRCGRCNTPICPRCLVQTPVGARCRNCANIRRIPTVDVSPAFLARGLAAGIAAGAAVGVFWGYAIGRGFGLFFLLFIALGIGYAISEAISLATNRKRGRALQACAVIGALVAYVASNLVVGDPAFPQRDTFGYLVALGAAIFGASRLKA